MLNEIIKNLEEYKVKLEGYINEVGGYGFTEDAIQKIERNN